MSNETENCNWCGELGHSEQNCLEKKDFEERERIGSEYTSINGDAGVGGLLHDLSAKDAEIERLKDGIYSMCAGFEDQARKLDPVQWLKTRLVHAEHYNNMVTRKDAEIERLKKLLQMSGIIVDKK